MMNQPAKVRHGRSFTESAAALIVALSCLVLVSGIVVLFMLLSSSNRKNTASYANSIKAEELARSGAESVVNQLRQEIVEHSTPNTFSGADTLYVPEEQRFVVPEVVPARNAPDDTPNLVKISTPSKPFYSESTTGNASTGTPLVSSSISTATPDVEGRFISLDRWNRPLLAQLGQNTTPNWVYLSRQGSVSTPAFPDSKTKNNANYVIGRFAYAIYNVGNLLDINVAGYPASLAPSDAGKKGSVALARLQALGLSDTQVNAIVGFRNPAETDYLNYLSKTDQHKGFTQTLNGDNRFFSRQELIRFAKLQGFENKLNLLTPFSRELNAPSFAPATPTANNGSLLSARHQGTGRQLFEKRFPLNKLRLLDTPSSNTADIKKYFGLVWDQTSRTFSYQSPIGTTTASTIKTLDQIAQEDDYRQPDFFETLKAALTQGSLGQNAGVTATTPEQTDPDFQIIRIGASIIDQYDADNIPTAIVFNPSGGSLPVFGVENLPYVNKLQYIGEQADKGFNSASTTNNPVGSSSPYLYYFRWAVELWNPHIQRFPFSVPGDVKGIRVSMGPVGATARVDLFPNSKGEEDDPADTKYGIEGTVNSSFEFDPIGGALTTPATQYRYFMDPRQVFFGYVNTDPFSLTTTEKGKYRSAALTFPNGGVYIDLHVKGADGFWHQYFRTWKIQGGPLKTSRRNPYYPEDPSLREASSFITSDPRTNRMGMFAGNFRLVNGVTTPNFPTTLIVSRRYSWPIRKSNSTSVNESVKKSEEIGIDKGYTGTDVYPALLYENTEAATQFKDPDGVIRMGDGGFAPGQADVPFTVLNLDPASNPTAAANPSRPIILNRPFRSVAELGYAFRDSAWKSLNFSGADSADAALLDAFALDDEPVQAGKVSLNTPYPEVWKAILEGSVRAEGDGTTTISSIEADTLASRIVNNLTSSTNPPLTNISEFVTRLSTPGTFTNAFSNWPIKMQREAAVRAVSGSMQSRTWNVMIDVIAQTGRFTPSADSPEKFLVEGEHRYWLHVAIDRYTGKVVDEQLESVHE